MKKYIIYIIIFLLSLHIIYAADTKVFTNYNFNGNNIYNVSNISAKSINLSGNSYFQNATFTGTIIVNNVNQTNSSIGYFNILFENSTSLIDKYMLRTGTNSNLQILKFNTTSGVPVNLTDGTCYYTDGDDSTYNCVVDANDSVVLQLGEELYLDRPAKNGDSVTIPNCAPVYLSGATGNNAIVKLSDAASYRRAQATIGLATQSIIPNNFGRITRYGAVNGCDTSNWTAGQQLFLTETPGVLTNIPPTGNITKVMVGTVIRSSSTNGAISTGIFFIPSIDDLSFVNFSNFNNQFLVYNNVSRLWDSTSIQILNDTSLIQSVNSSLELSKLNVTDQRYNDTTLIQSVNNSLINYALLTGNNTFSGKNSYYGDSWFYGDINIVNKSITQYQLSNGSSGLVLKDISNTTIGSWLDNNGSANLYTNGKVGIGIAPGTPKVKIQHDGGFITTFGTSYQYYGLINFLNDSNADIGHFGWADNGYYGVPSTGRFTFKSVLGFSFVNSTNNPNMVITDAGNVGIGTISPTSKLSVSGTLNVTGVALYWSNVGISVSSPRQALDVSGNIVTAFADVNNRIGMDYLDGSNYRNGLSFVASNRTTQLDALCPAGDCETVFRTGTVASPIERMIITNTGLVGIGTTSPTHSLTINGSLASLLVGDAFNYAPSKADFAVGSSTTSSRFLFGQSNSVYGGMKWNYNAAPTSAYLSVGVNTGGTTITGLNINNLGNVGIGTTSPTQALDVNGSVNVKGNITINSLSEGQSLILLNNATYWLDAPVAGLALAGGTFAPTLTDWNGTLAQLYCFAGGVRNEYSSGTLELPHSWKLESSISPHLHVSKSTANAGNYTFNIAGYIKNGTGSYTTTFNENVTITTGGQWDEVIQDWSNIDMTGFGVGTTFNFRITRLQDNALDTYPDCVGIKQVSVHFESDALGSASEYNKWS